jgi:transcriptional regulator with XRE-family HTH domain
MKNRFDISDFVPVVTEQSINKAIVERFKKNRKQFGITQKQLSLRSKVSYGSIRRFESSGEISLRALLKISSVIGCLEDFNELFQYPIITNLKDMKI